MKKPRHVWLLPAEPGGSPVWPLGLTGLLPPGRSRAQGRGVSLWCFWVAGGCIFFNCTCSRRNTHCEVFSSVATGPRCSLGSQELRFFEPHGALGDSLLSRCLVANCRAPQTVWDCHLSRGPGHRPQGRFLRTLVAGISPPRTW